MKLFDTLAEMGHEEVVLCSDPSIGYRGIIAVHSTRLGPALGGTRFWQYATDEEAIIDALRLSRGMTYKNAVAGLNLGGGKSIIIGDNKIKDREKIFRAHGRFVESLGGRYITAEDVGTSTRDMDFVHMETGHVAGLAGKSGDPSPVTAHGVFRAVQASANRMWGSDSLQGKCVAVQGCGSVGSYLAKELHEAGAKLIVSDIDPARTAKVAAATGAEIVQGDAIFSADADIFSPCALGGIINDKTIPMLKAYIVAGGANNQIRALAKADNGILYLGSVEQLELRGANLSRMASACRRCSSAAFRSLCWAAMVPRVWRSQDTARPCGSAFRSRSSDRRRRSSASCQEPRR